MSISTKSITKEDQNIRDYKMRIQKLSKFLILLVFFVSSMTLISITLINAQETENIYIISGEILENNINLDPFFYLGPGYDESAQSVQSAYSIEFFDSSNLLKTFKFDVYNSTFGHTYFFFKVDIPLKTKRAIFKHNAAIIREFIISSNPPVISSISVNEKPNGAYEINWIANDQNGDSLTYGIYYSNDNGANWQPFIIDFNGTKYTLNTAFLPGGNSLIKIKASDGFNTAEKISNQFYVPTKSPSAYIHSPIEGSEYIQGSKIVLEGFGYDPEDGFLEEPLSWSLNNNILGTGSYLTANDLSLGQHTITLTATDSEGKTAKEARNIAVTTETRPDVSIKELKFSPTELRETEPGKLEGSAFIQATLFNIRSDAWCDVSIYGKSSTIGNTTADTANLDKGLVLYMPFDEGSGSVAYDSSGNNNHGSLINGPAWVAGKKGNALSFDGSNDYVSIPASSIFNFDTKQFAMSFWIKTTSKTQYMNVFSYIDDSGTDPYYLIWFDNLAGLIGMAVSNNEANVIESLTDLATDSYHHIAITRNANNVVSIYVDGALDNTNIYGGFIRSGTASQFRIGKQMDPYPRNFNGIIDEVRIYNRALSAEEIKQSYDANSLGLLKSEKIYLSANSLGYAYATFTPAQTGDYNLSVKVSNCDPVESAANNNKASVSFKVLPYDTTPPNISLSINPSVLWPPNNKPVDVKISGSITDDISGVNKNSVGLVVDGTTKEITLAGDGSFNTVVPLIAKRAGQEKEGHKYDINLTASDNVGNNAITSAAVLVPHDQRK